METILACPNVTAIVWAGIAGQESGNGLADILYGATSPNGKLPYTIAKDASDYGTSISSGDDSYTEGLFIDYRHFDEANITPRYEFGFGLCEYPPFRSFPLFCLYPPFIPTPLFAPPISEALLRGLFANYHEAYTNFSYSELTTSAISASAGSTAASGAPGGAASLYDTVATVTAKVENTGKVTGAEVAQLYIGLPASAEAPLKQLRGFQKLSLEPGTSGTVTFSLRKKDLSYWDVASQSWVLPEGKFDVYVGGSSRDISLTCQM